MSWGRPTLSTKRGCSGKAAGKKWRVHRAAGAAQARLRNGTGANRLGL